MKRIVFFTFITITAIAVSFVLASPPAVVVTASSIQRWSVANGFYALNFFGDGTILAAQTGVSESPDVPGFAGVTAVKLDPRTGATIAPFFSPDVRTSIRLSTGDQDYVIGGYRDRNEVRQDGSYVRFMTTLGCCNVPRYPMPLDWVRNVGYVHANEAIFSADLLTGSDHYNYGPVDTFGMLSLADSDTLYAAGQQGGLAKLHPDTTGNEWYVNVGRYNLQPPAITSDKSLVVTSGLPHFHGSPEPGVLAKATSSGALWVVDVNAVTPPVIGGNGLIFVGTQAAPIDENGVGAIEARDPANGNLVWSTQVQGLPNDLLVGDDGAVYAGTGGFGNGRVYTIAQSDGEVRQIITDVTSAWEIVLRAGLLYASGANPYSGTQTSITALPVAANNYDVTSPWPVRFHDNQRTGNLQTPILTPPRISSPTPTPNPGPRCGSFPTYTREPDVLPPGNFQAGLAVGDFNNDGHQDMLFSSITTHTVSLRLGDGHANFSGSTDLNVPDYPWRIVTADFNHDGNLDFAVAGNNSGFSHVRLGDGNGGFDSGTDIAMSSSAAFMITADFNSDGNPDLATSGGDWGGGIVIRNGNGSGGFGPITSIPYPSPLSAIVAGDFNGDTRPDIAVAVYLENKVAIYLNNGAGGFNRVSDVPVGVGARDIALGDFNQDGHVDMAVTNEQSDTFSIRLGDGSGGFATSPDMPSADGPWAIVAVDLDNDGDEDLLQGEGPFVGILVGDGSASFVRTPGVAAALGNNVIATGDFNEDGIKDFASANNNSGPWILVWTGHCSLADSTAPTTASVTSPPSNAAGWNNTNVSAQLSAQDNDGGSGVASITYSASGAQAIGQTIVNGSTRAFNITSEGVTTISYFATDVAGNVEQTQTIVIKIDKTAPTIQLTSPTASTYLLNQSVLANFSCADGGSGINTCNGTTASGSAVNTSQAGSFSFTVAATDLAGNVLQQTVTYSVGYGIQILYDVTKSHKSGSTVPIKIRLVDANGNNLSSAGISVHAVSVIQTSTQASTVLDDSGNSNPDFDFRYEASINGNIFNLKTTGYGTGSYLLNFMVGNDPRLYSVAFQVRQ